MANRLEGKKVAFLSTRGVQMFSCVRSGSRFCTTRPSRTRSRASRRGSGRSSAAIGSVPVYNVAVHVTGRAFWIFELDVAQPAAMPIH